MISMRFKKLAVAGGIVVANAVLIAPLASSMCQGESTHTPLPGPSRPAVITPFAPAFPVAARRMERPVLLPSPNEPFIVGESRVDNAQMNNPVESIALTPIGEVSRRIVDAARRDEQSFAKNVRAFWNKVNPRGMLITEAQTVAAARLIHAHETRVAVVSAEDLKAARNIMEATVNAGLYQAGLRQGLSAEAAARAAIIPLPLRYSAYATINVGICYTMLERPALLVFKALSEAQRAVAFNGINRAFQFIFDYANRGGSEEAQMTKERLALGAASCTTVCITAYYLEKAVTNHFAAATVDAKTTLGRVAKGAFRRGLSAIIPAGAGHLLDLIVARHRELVDGTPLFHPTDLEQDGSMKPLYGPDGKQIMSREAGFKAVASCFWPRVQTMVLVLGTSALCMSAAERLGLAVRMSKRAGLALQCSVLFASILAYAPLSNFNSEPTPCFIYRTESGREIEARYVRGQ